jgi:hypothetical protein
MNQRLRFVVALAWMLYCVHVVAVEKIWRCGQEFTDKPSAMSEKDCQILKNNRIRLPTSSTFQGEAQRARDAKARLILEAELRQAEQRHAELSRQSANSVNVQAAIMRTQGDIAGLRREIERVR